MVYVDIVYLTDVMIRRTYSMPKYSLVCKFHAIIHKLLAATASMYVYMYTYFEDVTDHNVCNFEFRATLTYTIRGRNNKYDSRGMFGRKQNAEEAVALYMYFVS